VFSCNHKLLDAEFFFRAAWTDTAINLLRRGDDSRTLTAGLARREDKPNKGKLLPKQQAGARAADQAYP
jgi:hypothetical protein